MDFSIKAYARGVDDNTEKIEIGAFYPTATAKAWFIGKFTCAETLPPFDAFIKAFNAQFSRADHERQLRVALEQVHQGPNRSVIEHAAEFQSTLS